MLEPPAIPPAALLARVRERFGLPVEDAAFLPLGNDSSAWSFRVSGSGASWFLKVLARDVRIASLEIPAYLRDRGIEHVLAPLPTVAGDSFDPGNPFNLVVYPFVEASSGGDIGLSPEQRHALGTFLRDLHGTPVSPELAGIMRRERFAPAALETAHAVGRRVAANTPEDRFQRAFEATWRTHAREIANILARTEALAGAARRRSGPFVICHADFHAWNVLIEGPGHFVVVDWDEAILAPQERDLMFIDAGVGSIDQDGSAFYSAYGDVGTDPVVIAYYRFEWVVQELADYGRRVYEMTHTGETEREAALAFVAGLFDPGDVVEQAEQADAAGPILT